MRWLFERNILGNKYRETIFRFIKENPETYPQQIIRETNIGRGTVLYHLEILLTTGMVACFKEGKIRKYHVTQSFVKNAGYVGI